eukprot:TRINITY_DN28925_c0_g1_i1.p1 TRINITY_DN28925_c0_g1~~TRINITY_DN28925_c0_g1_i1.p1  ORF type:complete len:706 (+),score=116.99 TRINITY_DN28925_c0_g1_i1:52-2118(+)
MADEAAKTVWEKLGEQQRNNVILAFGHYGGTDGKITPDEMADVFKGMGSKLSREDVNKMFAAADLNSDGAINFQEFILWILGEKEYDVRINPRLGEELLQAAKEAASSGNILMLRTALLRLQRYISGFLPVAPSAAEKDDAKVKIEKLCKELESIVTSASKHLRKYAGFELGQLEVRSRGASGDPRLQSIFAQVFALLDYDGSGRITEEEGYVAFLHAGLDDSLNTKMNLDIANAANSFTALFQHLPKAPDLQQWLDAFMNWLANDGSPVELQVLLADDMLRASKKYVASNASDIVLIMAEMLVYVERALTSVVGRGKSSISRASTPSFVSAFEAVFEELLHLSSVLGVARTEYAVCVARWMTDHMEEGSFEKIVALAQLLLSGARLMPRYWDPTKHGLWEKAKGLGSTAFGGGSARAEYMNTRNLFAIYSLKAKEDKQAFQDLFDATFVKVYTRDRKADGVPDHLRVEMVKRCQNWHNWAEYTEKKAWLKKQMPLIKAFGAEAMGGVEMMATLPDCMTDGHLDQYRLDDDAETNTHFFFHGTTYEAAELISEGDFLVSLAGSNAGTLYGKGIYLAESCTKSDEYCTESTHLGPGTRTMLLCKASLGNILYNDEHKPNPDEIVTKCTTGPWHSCLGDRKKIRGTYREFMVYDDNQVYPEFIIHYTRRNADGTLFESKGGGPKREEGED